MNEDLVSIIIPTYNRAHLIGETLDSVIAQTYQDWECIVVDDGSADYTEELIEFYCGKDSRIQYHHRPQDRPKGANACRNYGFELSKGEIVNWFDSDDLMLPEFLEEKIAAFKSGVDMVISKHILISVTGKKIRKETRAKNSDNLLEDFISLKVSWFLPDPMYKRKFLEKKELFADNLYKGQDRDFHIRRLLENPCIKFVNSYLTLYRQTPVSISQDFNPVVIKSLYDAINNQINNLLKIKISNDLKYFLLKQQLKKYPYLYKLSSVNRRNLLLFKKLGNIDFRTSKWFFKYMLAVIAYRVTGKGYLFLKGE